MDNQHRKISGYRELSQEEIDLMNRIKAKGAELLALHDELHKTLQDRKESLKLSVKMERDGVYHNTGASYRLDEFNKAEPLRWSAIGKTDIQTGIMAYSVFSFEK